jgi:hypothetical protein
MLGWLTVSSDRLRLVCCDAACPLILPSPPLRYIDNTTVTADQLLAQPLQDFGVERFKAYVKIAQEGHSLPLRISEANSL